MTERHLSDHLQRLLTVALCTAAGLTALAVTAVLVYLGRRPAQTSRIEAMNPWLTGLATFVIVGGVALVCAGVALVVTRRRVESLTSGARDLASIAERYGSGEARIPTLGSGVSEYDQVSAVMARSAHNMTKSLAAERNFASDASHQLRTPLTALLMRLEEISVADDVDVVREEAGIAMDQVERLTRVVDELLGRTKDGSAPPPGVSLDTVLAGQVREWQPALAAARRSIRVSGERGLTVRCRPVALSQIMSTLVENSLQHGRGTVDIEARRAGPSVIVEVSDDGDGVAASLAPHIFERSVTSGGSGLGLALARDLAESNGGRLDLVQARPARFALFLSEARD